ncbi:MAG: Lrp/AsnC family transcriptional regulator [Inquilinus sp.]|uniref:Lrp/AsnC family transcriptional regulator n=1 Tax=Inquilinus sp. TaxID=1932117 RepID=UPI003F2B90DC
MQISLDSFDLKILQVLQEDARITMLDLAAQVGLSATPCARRVKRLEDEGLIDRYVTLLNAERLGLGLTVFVNVRLNSQVPKSFETFEAAIQRMPEVVGCYLLAGQYDYLVQVRVANVEAYRDLIRERLIAIEGVAETQSSIVLEQTKHTTALPVPII